MKQSKIKVYFDVDNKWEMEVFYLKENSTHENFALGDVGLEQPLSEKEMWDKYGPDAESKFLEDLDEFIDPFPIPSTDMNYTEPMKIKGCCPVGHEGVSGPRGMDEEGMYPLVLDSLEKFSKSQINIENESAREVLADGITKKIIKYMWHEEE